MKKLSWLALTLLLFAPFCEAAESAGMIRYMSGTLVAQRADGSVRVLSPKSQVQAGEVLVTGNRSYAQVVMNDGTKMTLRPNSNLKIETYQFKQEEPKADNAVFRLIKGGFRTVTGLIGKRGDKDAYKLRASGATIGIRGTDFTSRLCVTKGCSDENDSVVTPPPPKPKPVGRVMRIVGEMVAKDADGQIRKLTLGSPVYEGDTLQSNIQSHAVVAFRDGGRITLQENSIFKVEDFKYSKTGGVQENAALRLIKGGVRVVTGLIGRANRDNYKFRVSGATIGIRGTGFDAWCNGPCAEGASNFGAPQNNPMEGAGVYVWSGEVVLVAPGGSFTVALNQAAIIARETGKPVRVMTIPPAVQQNEAPRPDTVPVDVDKLFEDAAATDDPGLYVTVHDGQVILAKGDQKVDLGKGETGFTNDQILTRLAATPSFMSGDSNLEKIEFKEGDGSSGIDQQGCIVQ
ncbi:MAG: FecR domain-containing protein [Gammaproteobacteria bacterium]|nr:FecR domain-containing protein [Gammaproteobacteria bacterium]MDD2929607.1 FecR domain-containing protein [Sideroxydans sp.]